MTQLALSPIVTIRRIALKVHARFRLYEDTRSSAYSGGGYVSAARVKLQAVQGEPFGTSTPQGNVEMLIANPEAVALFREAPVGAEFDVVFSLVEPAS
jgi:hypothetical protein